MKAHIHQPDENLISEFSDYIVELTTLRTLSIILTTLKQKHGFSKKEIESFIKNYFEINDKNDFDKQAENSESSLDFFYNYLKNTFGFDVLETINKEELKND